jgi:hypothetical protein
LVSAHEEYIYHPAATVDDNQFMMQNTINEDYQ